MGVLRKTKSVRSLLSIIDDTESALSAVDLVDRVSDQMNKTTVYRILERLVEDGVIHSFTGLDGLTWYAKCKSCTSEKHIDSHPHFQCKDCGKTECLEIKVSIPSVPGHKVDSAHLLLLGLCESCRG